MILHSDKEKIAEDRSYRNKPGNNEYSHKKLMMKAGLWGKKAL